MSRIGFAPALVASAALALAPAAHAQQRAAGARPDSTSVEAGLWAQSEKAEKTARASAELNGDPALNAYVRDVTCKVAAEYCNDIRVYVMDRPFFNATMAPNGYTEVWSGLMLRATTESELAFVLSHEVTHFTENHSIEALQAEKARRNAALAISVGLAVAGAAAAAGAGTADAAQSILDVTGNLIDVVYLGAMASYFGFSREQESQADKLGFERAAHAGYVPTAGAALWRSMAEETAASEFKRVRESEARVSVFRTHPLTRDRIAALETLAKAASSPSTDSSPADRHRAAIRPHLAAWLKDDLRRRDFGETLHLLDRLAHSGQDLGVIEFYRGEAYRLRHGAGDLERAEAAYAAATAHPDAPVAVWRQLGDLRAKSRNVDGAREAYQSYLAKAPEADDAWLVQDAMNSLTRGGT